MEGSPDGPGWRARSRRPARARPGGSPTSSRGSWRGYGGGLADALEAAAAEPGPTPAALREVAVPAGLAALPDDPVHPLAVAREWHALLPRAALRTTTLAAVGPDPGTLGRAAALAWQRARQRPGPGTRPAGATPGGGGGPVAAR